MRKIVVGQYISLDGVVESPERWHFPYANEELFAALGAAAASSDTMLLGRVTYDVFAGTFAGAPASDPVATMLNNLKKVVVTSSPESLAWQNSSALPGDVVDAVSRLKAGEGGTIMVNGSLTLVRTLLRAGLVDELSLFVHPLVVGEGRRLFGDDGQAVPLELVSSTVFTTGVVHQIYRVA